MNQQGLDPECVEFAADLPSGPKSVKFGILTNKISELEKRVAKLESENKQLKTYCENEQNEHFECQLKLLELENACNSGSENVFKKTVSVSSFFDLFCFIF